jgi:hypothetical protein
MMPEADHGAEDRAVPKASAAARCERMFGALARQPLMDVSTPVQAPILAVNMSRLRCFDFIRQLH